MAKTNKSRSQFMSEEVFWDLIEETKSDDPQDQLDHLVELLSSKSVEEILGFDYRLDKFLEKSYNPNLWAAGYIVCDGMSDDSFDYFRAWLISKGKDVYESALKNPDSLINVFEKMNETDFPENEEILYAGLDAYEQVTEKEDFYDVIDSYEDDFQILEIELNWDEDDPETLKNICPKLFERYYEEPFY
ncbi:MAG: DUF4240 domain-containing protein [Methanimicrococcus sp.]|nr:DUF4240 domain-containing protein [Methanimicrococcus sp.]MCL2142174.1 DUF4240 domain-containing protein [Methanimicrococcus sp.]MCL2142584.1 DUF4240 domain-containing protein [Methanimicrococcus sp.]